MKICTLCKKEQELNQFNIKKSYHDGYSPWCKSCKKIKCKNYYENNKKAIKTRTKNYYHNNKRKILNFTPQQIKRRKEYNKKYKQKNKSIIIQYQKNYNVKNSDKISINRKVYNSNNREKNNKTRKLWLEKNPVAKMGISVRKRLREVLLQKGFFKTTNFNKYLGCSNNFFKTYIENKFTENMSWDNYGEWHIDHIMPLASAQTEEEVFQLSHYTNLQPMWALKNISKNNKITKCWQRTIRETTLNEDLNNGLPLNPPISEFIFSQEPLNDEHKEFIERYEWLGTIGFGVRYVFTARHNGILGGVVMIAEPNSYQFDIKTEALIQRGACAGWTPKNLGSKLIMFSCKWMVNNTNKRLFVAYSDPEAGEIGTIYQACNFDYLGQHFGASYYYILENGKKVTDRYFSRTSSMKKWAKELDIKWQEFWCKPNGFQDIKAIPEEIKIQIKEYIKNKKSSLIKEKSTPKGKYILLLKKNKRENLQKSWTSEPYPKRL